MLGCHVVVTGGAGAGKSTVAAALAEALGVVLLSKDRLKETIHEAVPANGTAESLRLSAAAMHVLYDTAANSPGGTVLDANWRRQVDDRRLAELPLPLLQVFCDVPPQIAQQRLLDRVRSGRRHPVHRDAMDPELLQRMVDDAAKPGQPLPLAGPLVRVDTSSTVDVAVLARQVETCAAALRAPAPGGLARPSIPDRDFHHRALPERSSLLAGRHPEGWDLAWRSEWIQVLYNDTSSGWRDDGSHAHEHSDEIFIVLEGTVVVDVDGERVEVGPGEFCCFPAGLRHAVIATRPPLRTFMLRAPSIDDKFMD